MAAGTVKWFNAAKGFGFVVNAEGQDVFVHFSSIESEGFRMLRPGEKVEFEQASGAKGLRATRVKPLRTRRARASGLAAG